MTPERRPTFLVDLRLAIQRAGKTIGMAADEARVPPHVLRQFLDGHLDLPQVHLMRLETWYNQQVQANGRRPIRMADFPSPLLRPTPPPEPPTATRHLNMASLAREHETMRRQIESLRSRVEHLEGRLTSMEARS